MHRLVSIFVIIGAALAIAPLSAHAGATTGAGEGRATITVAPISYEATVEPGRTSRGQIDVFNVGDTPVTVRAEVEGIRVGDDGAFEFREPARGNRIEAFVDVDRAPFRLAPGMARRVAFSIRVPTRAWTGGYFGSILFRILPPEGRGGLAIRQQARVGTLLILRADGPADQRGELVDVEATGSLLAHEREVGARYRNTGGVDGPVLGIAYRPSGTIEVRDLFGRRVHRDKVEGRLLLPGDATRLRSSIDRRIWAGRYTATMRVASGPGGRSQSDSVTFWAVSPAVLGWFLVFLGIAFGITIVRRRRRSLRNEP